jgi:tetratricopeptide (TPR) repeat protein
MTNGSRSASGSLAVVFACALTSLASDARAQAKRADRVRADARTGDASAQQAGSGSIAGSYQNALRIARMLSNDRIVAQLLARQGLMRGASDAELRAVIAADEIAGEPEAAASFLRHRIALYPTEKRSRVLLAGLFSRSGDSKRAVLVWRELIDTFGKDALSFVDAHSYARDLSRVGDVEAAYAVLTSLLQKAPLDAKDYWIDLATLAWDRDDDVLALVAYETVYRLDPKTPHAGARLLALLADAKREDDAVKLALSEHARTGDPQPVLFAAHLRAARNEWAGVKEVLDAAEKNAPPSAPSLRQSEDFLLLRGDSSKQLGDLRGANDAYRRALVIAPASMSVRSNVLWSAIELGDPLPIRQLAVAWRGASLGETAMWSPMAVAFAKLGMFQEALPFFELQLRANPLDGHLLLDVADLLSKGARYTLARDLRRRAVVQLRGDALRAIRAPKPTVDDLRIVESTAVVIRERAGNAQGEKWLAAMRASNPRFANQEETALDWYMTTDRPEHARRILDRKTGSRKDLRNYRLAIAMLDEDRSAMSALLDASKDLPPAERMHASVLLDNDRAAATAIGEGLGPGAPVDDEPAMRQELQRIHLLHRPNVRASALYFHVTGLDIVGAQASASHDALRGRVIYSATGVEMRDRSNLLEASSAVREAEGGALYRHMTARGVTEASAAFNYQDQSPVARGALFDQRLLTRRLGLTSELRAGQRIDDTSLLRLVAVRNVAALGLRYDEHRWYASAELEGREDQTRRYEHLAWDVVESAEVGVKVLTREPHLSIGAQAQASQRDTRTALPSSISSRLSPRFDPASGLPPSFQAASAVIHFSRGDFLERYRPDRAPFPRYDCEGAIGALFPDTDTALHVLCGVSVRAPGGYTSLLAFYNRGIAGVRNNENAEVALSHTIPF